MRFVLALAAFVLVAISAADAAAQGRPAYYCDPLHVYSPPYTGNCPVPWRAVYSPTAAPQPYGATPPASQGPIQLVPQAARPNFPALGDGLDDWCKTAELPSSIAICSDRELRALVLERQRAYDGAKAGLNPDQQKALLADQNEWVRTYPRTCGLTDAPQSLPLAPAIKDCMAEAGRARIAYLKAYGLASPPPEEVSAPPLGTSSFPSRDAYCETVQSVSAALYRQVDGLAQVFHRTYTDIITLRPDAIDVPGAQNVDWVDYRGMIRLLMGWDTTLDEIARFTKAYGATPHPIESRAAGYVRLVGDECRRDNLRLDARDLDRAMRYGP
jgi:uncharacterized protein YecT (DUF1311 family)